MAKKILLVEDNELMREVMNYILTGKGYEVCEAPDGDNIFNDIREQHPDLVILDVLMPGLNGREICRLLKMNRATKDLPVIICSGSDDIDKALTQKGAPDDILHKPFGMYNLIEKVEMQLAA